MRGLRIIPMFIGLIILSYFGMWFVDQNRTEVTLNIGAKQLPPTALGFLVLTSILIGMVIAGALCSIELLTFYMANRRLKARLKAKEHTPASDTSTTDQPVGPRATGRFT